MLSFAQQVSNEIGWEPQPPTQFHLVEGDELSVQALSWVFDFSKSKLGSRLVLLSIANHAKADGTGAWPSISTICIESKLSEREVRYCLRELEELGELNTSIGSGPSGTNLYSLNMRGAILAPGAFHDIEGGNLRQEGGHPIAPEPSLTVLNTTVSNTCSACGATGIHKCPGRLNEKQRAKRQGTRPSQRLNNHQPQERPQYKSWDQIRREEDDAYEQMLKRVAEGTVNRRNQRLGKPVRTKT